MAKLAYRKSIRELLEVIADPAKQRLEGVTEIICGWFDDFYLPADDPELYAPGVHEKGINEFKSCFSEEELAAIRKFHNFFSTIVKEIDTGLPISIIQEDPKWIRLGEEASEALNTFDQRPTRL